MPRNTKDYVGTRIIPAERAILDEMIRCGQASSMTQALHILAFENQSPLLVAANTLSRYTDAVSAVHQSLCRLIANGAASGDPLTEAQMIRLEREVRQHISTENASALREIRMLLGRNA